MSTTATTSGLLYGIGGRRFLQFDDFDVAGAVAEARIFLNDMRDLLKDSSNTIVIQILPKRKQSFSSKDGIILETKYISSTFVLAFVVSVVSCLLFEKGDRIVNADDIEKLDRFVPGLVKLSSTKSMARHIIGLIQC